MSKCSLFTGSDLLHVWESSKPGDLCLCGEAKMRDPDDYMLAICPVCGTDHVNTKDDGTFICLNDECHVNEF